MQSHGRVAAFVDWENIRQRLADNYTEKITIEQVLTAIEKVANEIGQLQSCTVFGDWSLRRDEAYIIQQKQRFKPYMVLRSGRKDQTDPAMIAEILETCISSPSNSIGEILVCAGDSNYADVIRRGFSKDVRMHVCAVGIDVAKELTALAPFYPLERYLDKLPNLKRPTQVGLPGLSSIDPKFAKLIDVLNSVEQRLPYVVYTYFRGKIMPMYPLLQQESEALLREARNHRGNATRESSKPWNLIPLSFPQARQRNCQNDTFTIAIMEMRVCGPASPYLM